MGVVESALGITISMVILVFLSWAEVEMLSILLKRYKNHPIFYFLLGYLRVERIKLYILVSSIYKSWFDYHDFCGEEEW